MSKEILHEEVKELSPFRTTSLNLFSTVEAMAKYCKDTVLKAIVKTSELKTTPEDTGVPDEYFGFSRGTKFERTFNNPKDHKKVFFDLDTFSENSRRNNFNYIHRQVAEYGYKFSVLKGAAILKKPEDLTQAGRDLCAKYGISHVILKNLSSSCARKNELGIHMLNTNKALRKGLVATGEEDDYIKDLLRKNRSFMLTSAVVLHDDKHATNIGDYVGDRIFGKPEYDELMIGLSDQFFGAAGYPGVVSLGTGMDNQQKGIILNVQKYNGLLPRNIVNLPYF